ncbi:MAG: C10 family peptidase [Spirochaetota bacterium]|jgi:hypothetical protein|nr:C10 family peptidase [Spirochaetota bacterium]
MKNRTLYTLGVALFIMLGILSCAYELYEETNAKPISLNQYKYLSLLKASGEYVIEEEKLRKMIAEFLNPKSEERAVAAKKVTITDSKKLPLAKRIVSGSPARFVAAEEQDAVQNTDVYVFSTENADGIAGYVLASTDMRIGNILAIADGRTWEDEEEWLTDLVFEGIEGYIDRTINEYENISEEEIMQLLLQPPATPQEANMRATLPPGDSGSGSWSQDYGTTGLVHLWYPDAPLVSSANWTWTGGYYAYVPVHWRQGNPYNFLICKSRMGDFHNDDWVTGCGPTAAAQIMAYYGCPVKCTLNVVVPNVGMNFNNYVYDWAVMKTDCDKVPAGVNTISSAAEKLSVLMYEIGYRASASYWKKTATAGAHTSVSSANMVSAIKAMGYTTGTSGFVSYNVGTITESIAAGMPVLMSGETGSNGHMWVADGVRKMEYTEWYADGSGGLVWYGGWDFVHCNTGWERSAWYVSGIFDFRNEYQSKILSIIPQYYQYNVQMLPGIRPK